MRDSDIKQVLVYRHDLSMRGGKMAAQIGHAVMKPFWDRGTIRKATKAPQEALYGTVWGQGSSTEGYELVIPLTPEMHAWSAGRFTKIVLCVDSEEDLLRIHELAEQAGIPTALILDAGTTEFRADCPACDGLGEDGVGFCSHCEGAGKIPVPTHTAVGLGPALASEIDKITGPDGAVPTRLA
jgi:PTH2 family peptidyl-tRNA hydrolase